MRKSWLIIVTLFGFIQLSAQHNLGLRSSIFSGSQGILTNPTATSDLPYMWDATLFGGAAFFDNNIGYIEESGILDLTDGNVYVSPLEDADRNATSRYIEFTDHDRTKYLVTRANVYGPAFAIQLNDFNLGFFTGFRSIVSTTNGPDTLDINQIRTNSIGTENFIQPFSVNGLAYQEYAVNVSKAFDWQAGSLRAGINAKYLLANQAITFQLVDPLHTTYESQDSATMLNTFIVAPSRAKLGYSTKEDEASLDAIGTGFGIDLGLTYRQDIGGELDFMAGFSIQDIGSINIDQDAVFYDMTLTEEVRVEEEDYQDIETLDEVIQTFRTNSGTADSATTSDAFRMGLPTTLHLFGTKRLRENLYISAQFSQGIPLTRQSPHTGSFLSVMPYFEKKWYGIYLPVSTYQFDDLRIGLAAKLAFLTVGTEDLGSLFGKKELYGTDFYVALKLFPFGKGGTRNRGGKGVECFEF